VIRRRWFLLPVIALVLVTGAVVAGDATGRAPVVAGPDLAAERARLDADIDFYTRHAELDPTGALDHLRLAALYLQRARDRGTPADIARAEMEARHSLANRREHNSEAFRAIALALMGEHRFVEARMAADSLLAADTTAAGARSLLGEIDLELGLYPQADAIFSGLDRSGADPGVLARTSRWASLRGRSAHAHALLEHARDVARQTAGTPVEQLAWYDLRLGELALTVGQFGDAHQHLDAARRIAPDDARILIALARLALAEQQPRDAARWAEAAMNAGEDPYALALAAQAHRALGDRDKADHLFQAFETVIAGVPPLAWHRQWRLALLDHDAQLPAVLAQAYDELLHRRDVYGWDLYAWALHRAGRDSEARVAMREALRWQTEDILLDAHARAIGVSR
jgi:tetratricopeptide (TPR) repeat protein